MSIVDIKRGNYNIVRAYKGSELIFERSKYYIQRIDDFSSSDPSYSKDTYIHIDDVELMYNWTYEAEVSGLVNNPQNRIWCFLGGSFNSWLDNRFERHIDGIFLGLRLPYRSNVAYESLVTDTNCNDSYNTKPKVSSPVIVNDRHVIRLKLDSIPTDHYGDNTYQGTANGFHILSARNEVYWTYGAEVFNIGEAINMYMQSGSLYKNRGKIFRISLYDENNILIHNYLPREINNHKGVYDTVINKFYPCSDDTKFIIDKEA